MSTTTSLQALHHGAALDGQCESILMQTAALASTLAAQELTVEKRRQLMHEGAAFLRNTPIASVSHQNMTIKLVQRELPARLYSPSQCMSDVLVLYFHGGGWVIGDLDTHHAACEFLCERLGMKLLSVEYRKAPEHVFPAACEDAVDTVAWAHTQLAQFACQRLAVMGDSAGGHLSAVAMHTQPQLVSAALLFYPATDMQFSNRSAIERGAGPGLTRDAMLWYWQQFINPMQAPPTARLNDPRAVPMLQTRKQAAPPTVIIAAWHDPLYDEAVTYAQHLAAAGTQVQMLHAADMPHGFVRHVFASPSAKAHVSAALAAFKQMLQQHG